MHDGPQRNARRFNLVDQFLMSWISNVRDGDQEETEVTEKSFSRN